MRDHEQDFIAILAAICLSSSANVGVAVDKAVAIMKTVKERFPNSAREEHERG